MPVDLQDEKEWTSGPRDMLEGLNSMVATINKLIAEVKELRRANQPIEAVVWNAVVERWMNVSFNGLPGGEAVEPSVNCVCECGSGTSESFGDV